MQILVVGVNRLMRDLLVQSLSSLPDFDVLGDAVGFTQSLRALQSHVPDIVLIDARDEFEDALQFACTASKEFPELHIALLAKKDAELPDSTLSGPAALITDNLSLEQFVEALRAVSRIQSGDNELLKIGLSGSHIAGMNPVIKMLSPREVEVLAYLAEGLGNREIGERLFVSEFTVKAHLRRIYRKLGINNRSKACLLAANLLNEKKTRNAA